jgi:hypothetical protein
MIDFVVYCIVFCRYFCYWISCDETHRIVDFLCARLLSIFGCYSDLLALTLSRGTSAKSIIVNVETPVSTHCLSAISTAKSAYLMRLSRTGTVSTHSTTKVKRHYLTVWTEFIFWRVGFKVVLLTASGETRLSSSMLFAGDTFERYWPCFFVMPQTRRYVVNIIYPDWRLVILFWSEVIFVHYFSGVIIWNFGFDFVIGWRCCKLLWYLG